MFYVPAMRSLTVFAALAAVIVLPSCGVSKEKEKKPVGPQSSANRMPWNTPVTGQGGGQMGMMPQMNQRR